MYFNISVLYVEDDDSVREIFYDLMKNDFFKLFIAKDAKEGLELFKEKKPDLVITDLRMPNLDGLSLVKEIKKIEPKTNIILLTAYSDIELAKEMIKTGINCYLTKPTNFDELFTSLEKNTQDILDRKEKENLYTLLQDYKDTVDLNNIVSKANVNGIITYANDKFLNISGYTKEELIGMPHNIVRHPDTSKEIFNEMWKTIKIDKKPWYGKLKNRKKDGSHYYVDTVIKPILDNEQNILEFIAVRKDITDIEDRKTYLKEQYDIASEKYEDIVKLSQLYEEAMNKSSIVIRISLELNINYVNDNFCNLTGYNRDELVNKPYNILLHPDISKKQIDKMFEKATKNSVWKGNLIGITKDGKNIYFTTTLLPIKNRNNEIIEYMAVRNDITKITELHTELEETQREIIYRMGEIGETRSQETAYHVKRVAKYSELLALKAGLTKEEAKLIKQASPMHDIGKVGIPDSILNKPGKLSFDEFEHMKLHTTIGYELFKDSNREILKASAIIAHEHHEKWDGSGYPRGLKGNEIHIFGRITAICDVFDALSHERVYKKAWELEKILEFLIMEKGKHFDPSLVNIFLENLDEFIQIRNLY